MLIPKISEVGRFKIIVPVETMVPEPTVLAVSVPAQKKTNWCWAAVGLGIASAYGTAQGIDQCDVASRVLAQNCCPYGESCNEPWPVRCALPPHYVNTYDAKGHQRMEFVKKHIDAGHPIAVRIHRRSSRAGHAVVISGYLETHDESSLWICDPWGGDLKPWAFDKFLSHYEEYGFWDNSFETGGGVIRQMTQEELREASLA